MSNPRPSDRPSALANSKIARLGRLRRLSHVLDNAIKIPIIGYRIGLDPILGLIPGGGDTAGLVLSAYILLEAARLGASKSVLGQMAGNVLLETLVGTVPGLGDVFDAAWKSNARNVHLLEEHLNLPHHVPQRNRGFALLLIAGLVLAVVAAVFLSVFVLRWLVQTIAAN